MKGVIAAVVAAALIAATGATAALVVTSANIKNGAQSPIAGVVHALTVLVVLLVASPLAKHVPLPALAAAARTLGLDVLPVSAQSGEGLVELKRRLLLLVAASRLAEGEAAEELR